MNKWRLARIGGLVFGGLFLVTSIVWLGPADIFRFLFEVKGWFLLVLLNSSLWYLSSTAAWKNYFSNLDHQIPFLHLLKIKVCGEAVNTMTPVGFVAGDPVRILLLQKQLGRTTRLGSVIVDRLLHSLASVTFVLTGLLLLSTQAVSVTPLVRWVLLGLYFLLVLLLGFVVLELVKGNGLRIFHPFFLKLGLSRRFPKMESHLADLNEEFSGFAGGGVFPFVKAFLLHFIGRALGACEIALIFLYLTGDPHPVSSVILASLTTVLHLVFAFVPGGIGLVESLYGGFFYLEGLNPAQGVSMQLIRRLRALFWIAFGLVLLKRWGQTPRELTKG